MWWWLVCTKQRASGRNGRRSDRRRDPQTARAQAERHLRLRARDLFSKLSIAPGGLPAPFSDGRPLGSALYFMMSPADPVKLHRIKNDQLYHHYLGDPIEVLMPHDDGTHTFAVVGSDLRANQRVQLFIPGNTFHTAQIRGTRRWFLGASTEWPGVVPTEDVELGDAKRSPRAIPTSPPRSAASLCLRVSSRQFMLRRRSCRHGPARRARSRSPAHAGSRGSSHYCRTSPCRS